MNTQILQVLLLAGVFFGLFMALLELRRKKRKEKYFLYLSLSIIVSCSGAFLSTLKW